MPAPTRACSSGSPRRSRACWPAGTGTTTARCPPARTTDAASASTSDVGTVASRAGASPIRSRFDQRGEAVQDALEAELEVVDRVLEHVLVLLARDLVAAVL